MEDDGVRKTGHPRGRSVAGEVLRVKASAERALRDSCSEHVLLQVHDGFAPVTGGVRSVADCIEDSVCAALGIDPATSPRRQHRAGIARLRVLLDQNARERALQDALLESGLLGVTCKVIDEVAMVPTSEHRGMRMDLVLGSSSDQEPTQIVELKRGKHLLLARPGGPTERISSELRQAVGQLREYGRRLGSDATARASIEQRHGIRIENPELRLVAGRRLSDAHGYHLLSSMEAHSEQALQLRIYTWDGWLAELERLVG